MQAYRVVRQGKATKAAGNQVEKDGEGTYDDEPEFIERPMNGYSLMFAEIPEDGAVSVLSGSFVR
mgnify:CR=1 FL=1